MSRIGKSNALTRETWLEKTLEAIPSGYRILDAGAGEQQFKKFCPHLNYVAQDFGKYDGLGDNAGLQVGKWDQSKLDIVCDITDIPEPSDAFDAIMCVEVFEHLPNPIAAIKEFSRLLRPGGYLIITAPFCSWTHFAPFHFYSGFNRYFYQRHLTENDFEILEVTANGNFFEYVGQEVRRIKNRSAKYSGDRPNILERLATSIILRMLERFSRNDKGSDELLCFGYHVLARKRGNNS